MENKQTKRKVTRKQINQQELLNDNIDLTDDEKKELEKYYIDFCNQLERCGRRDKYGDICDNVALNYYEYCGDCMEQELGI